MIKLGEIKCACGKQGKHFCSVFRCRNCGSNLIEPDDDDFYNCAVCGCYIIVADNEWIF